MSEPTTTIPDRWTGTVKALGDAVNEIHVLLWDSAPRELEAALEEARAAVNPYETIEALLAGSRAMAANVRKLLTMLAGPPTPCRNCGRDIWFVTNPKTGKSNPITEEALNHFADCPGAKEFKR